MNDKKVQIPQKLLIDVLRLASRLQDYELTQDDLILVNEIETQIEGKIERIKQHKLYTQSKTALTDEEKERARQDYLNIKGIHEDWRY